VRKVEIAAPMQDVQTQLQYRLQASHRMLASVMCFALKENTQ